MPGDSTSLSLAARLVLDGADLRSVHRHRFRGPYLALRRTASPLAGAGYFAKIRRRGSLPDSKSRTPLRLRRPGGAVLPCRGEPATASPSVVELDDRGDRAAAFRVLRGQRRVSSIVCPVARGMRAGRDDRYLRSTDRLVRDLRLPLAEQAPVAMNPAPHQGDRALLWIGAFKFGKGLLLLVFATGILACVHHDLQATAGHLVEWLHFDPDNRHLAGFLNKLGLVDDRRLKELGGLTFVYAAVLLTKGTGLMFKKRWAEYLTVVATASLIPVELFELFRHFTPIKHLCSR